MERAIRWIANERIEAAYRDGLFDIRLGADVPLQVDDAGSPEWYLRRVCREEDAVRRAVLGRPQLDEALRVEGTAGDPGDSDCQ